MATDICIGYGGSGFSAKLNVKGSFSDDKLSFALNNQFYRLYSRNGYSDQDYFPQPSDPPADVEGDNSRGTFYHLEGQINYNVWRHLSLTARCDWFRRSTFYNRSVEISPSASVSAFPIDSKQLSFQLMLTYRL